MQLLSDGVVRDNVFFFKTFFLRRLLELVTREGMCDHQSV